MRGLRQNNEIDRLSHVVKIGDTGDFACRLELIQTIRDGSGCQSCAFMEILRGTGLGCQLVNNQSTGVHECN